MVLNMLKVGSIINLDKLLFIFLLLNTSYSQPFRWFSTDPDIDRNAVIIILSYTYELYLVDKRDG